MMPMMPMMPYHDHGFFRPPTMFDPFSLFFWDDFPCDFPVFGAPPYMAPPLIAPSRPFPPRPLLPQMRGLVPRAKIEHKETPEAHHFMAELPGMRKEDVVVKVGDGNMLHVRAKRNHEKEENKESYHHVERGFGEFVSKFMLPPDAIPQQLRSCVDNGVLTITIPKQKGHQPQSSSHPQPQSQSQSQSQSYSHPQSQSQSHSHSHSQSQYY